MNLRKAPKWSLARLFPNQTQYASELELRKIRNLKPEKPERKKAKKKNPENLIFFKDWPETARNPKEYVQH